MNYYTVGKLKELLANVSDDCPVVASPINDKIKVAIDVTILNDAEIGDYKGDIVMLTTGLFDIATNKEINLING